MSPQGWRLSSPVLPGHWVWSADARVSPLWARIPKIYPLVKDGDGVSLNVAVAPGDISILPWVDSLSS